jgi:hypothetical protein
VWKKPERDQTLDMQRLSYHFGNHEPRFAILEEILDSDAVTLPDELPRSLPRAVLQSNGAYHPLPRKAELAVPTP